MVRSRHLGSPAANVYGEWKWLIRRQVGADLISDSQTVQNRCLGQLYCCGPGWTRCLEVRRLGWSPRCCSERESRGHRMFDDEDDAQLVQFSCIDEHEAEHQHSGTGPDTPAEHTDDALAAVERVLSSKLACRRAGPAASTCRRSAICVKFPGSHSVDVSIEDLCMNGSIQAMSCSIRGRRISFSPCSPEARIVSYPIKFESTLRAGGSDPSEDRSGLPRWVVRRVSLCMYDSLTQCMYTIGCARRIA